MRNFEAEMSQEQLKLANSLLADLGINGEVTVNEMLNEIARIAKKHDAVITFEEQ